MRRWLDSLVKRAVLFVVGVVVVTALLVTVAGTLLSRSELEQQAADQVTTIARLAASDLDDTLSQRLETLSYVAQELSMSRDSFGLQAKARMRRQGALSRLFDAVYLIDEQGKAIAGYPGTRGMIGTDVSDRLYFQKVSKQLTPVISEPYRSHYQGSPSVMLAVPVFDHKQRFIGVLGGVISLAGDHLIEELFRIRIGDTGYIAVVTHDGTVLANGRSGEVMQPVRGTNPILADAMEGFEGTAQTRNSQGEKVILSVRQMAQVPWFVAAVWPAREAYASTIRIKDAFLWVLLAVLLLVVPVAMWRFRRLMAPLQTLGKQVYERHLGLRSDPVGSSGWSEINQVADIFNTVMDERDHAMSVLAEREAFFRSLTQGAPVGIVQADVLGRIEFVNPAFESISGLTQEEVSGSHLFDCILPDDRDAVTKGWQQARQQQKVFRNRLRLKGADVDHPVWCQITTAPLATPEKVMGTITIVRDISRELEVEATLRDEQRRAESILEVIREGVLMADTSGRIRYANHAVGRFLGTSGEFLGKNVFELIAIEHEEQVLPREWFLEQDRLYSLYATLRNHSGEILDVDLSMIHIRHGKENERLVLVLRDDTERRREKERLSWEATHDPLTQLLNRRAFNAALAKCLTEPAGEDARSVLMLIDLDRFKPVNDEGGHLLGDELLQCLAGLFKESVRQSDTVARIGGDEFGIILPGCGLDRAKTLAEGIRARVEACKLEQKGRKYGVTVSIGVTELVPEDHDSKHVVARADKGTYLAKSQGRNRIVVMPAPGYPE